MSDLIYTIIIYPIVQIIECIFVFAQKLFKETGISIICVSAAVSLLCLPLYMAAERWQEVEREIQRRLAPKVSKIKAVFSGDERYMILSTYYRQNHYHPVYALRGAFGLLIQIPFFIAAYGYLSHLEELRGASFLFIADLGKPDALLPGGFNLLPFVMTLINIIAGAVYTRNLELKDKAQLYGMSLIFLILLYNSPAGLLVYWTLNNVFSLVKNIYLKIDFPKKRFVVFTAVSFLCVIVSLYILFVLKRDMHIKIIISALFIAIALVPWSLPLAKKALGKIMAVRHVGFNLFLIFFLSLLGLGLLTGAYLPVMLTASSPQEFSHIDSYGSPLIFIAYAAVKALGFFVFWPLCIYFLVSVNARKALSCAVLALFITALCNAFLFSGDYGLISIDLIFDQAVQHDFHDMLINLGILMALGFCAAVFFVKWNFKAVLPLILIPLVSLMGVAGLNIGGIQNEYQKTQEFYTAPQKITAIEPLFQLTTTGVNTIIIMLDRATSAFIPFILDESPELADIYSGFIYYPNTVSFSGYTWLGAPPLFGGYEYTPQGFNKRNQISMREKHNEALLLLPRIFSEAGYHVTITDPPYPNYSSKGDMRIYEPYPLIKPCLTDGAYNEYWLLERHLKLPSNSDLLKRNLILYSFFKIMPLALREGIYQHGDWFSLYSSHKFSINLNSYAVLDYLPRLTGITEEKENAFLFMVNNTTHEAMFYQAPEYRPVLNVSNYGKGPFSNESEYHTNIGALKRLGEWLVYLKLNKAYDNTRIIIVSDHGSQRNYVAKTHLPFNLDNVNPLLLVKDFNAQGKLKTDMQFMTNADVPLIALQDQISGVVNPWTGNPMSVDKGDELYIALSEGFNLGSPDATSIALNDALNYYVHDNIFIEQNWIPAKTWNNGERQSE